MEQNLFIVAYTRHNRTTGGTSYKVEIGTPDYNAAKKKYHALLAEAINSADFDFISVILYDAYGNKLDSEYWQASVEE